MKKLLISVAIVLGYNSISYGMDINQMIAQQRWLSVADEIQKADETALPGLINQLVNTQTNLNEGGLVGTGVMYLFDILLGRALTAGAQPLSNFENINEILVLKALLKHDKINPNSPRDRALMPRLQALRDEVCQIANREKAAVAGPQQPPAVARGENEINDTESLVSRHREIKQSIDRTGMQIQWLVFGSVAVGVALAYAFYCWYIQKGDKSVQEEGNLGEQHEGIKQENQEVIVTK